MRDESYEYDPRETSIRVEHDASNRTTNRKRIRRRAHWEWTRKKCKNDEQNNPSSTDKVRWNTSMTPRRSCYLADQKQIIKTIGISPPTYQTLHQCLKPILCVSVVFAVGVVEVLNYSIGIPSDWCILRFQPSERTATCRRRRRKHSPWNNRFNEVMSKRCEEKTGCIFTYGQERAATNERNEAKATMIEPMLSSIAARRVRRSGGKSTNVFIFSGVSGQWIYCQRMSSEESEIAHVLTS